MTAAYVIEMERRERAARRNDSSRRRRFAGGARGRWYAEWRRRRFAARMGLLILVQFTGE